MPRSLLPLASALALLGSGCAALDPDPTLRQFESCDEMESYMQDMALKEARWWWSFDFSIGFGQSDFALATDDLGLESGGGASSYSSTNLQEQGVDEDDLVKTDGSNLFSIAGRHLVISKAWPVEEAAQLSAVEIDGQPEGLYLLEDAQLVAVVSQHLAYQRYVYDDEGGSEAVGPSPLSGEEPSRQADYTQITLVDISDLSAPVVVRESYLTGAFKESRRIGDELYLVTYEDIDVTAEAGNLREARKAVRKATLESWLPLRFDNKRQSDSSWQVSESRACACTDVWYADRLGGTYITHVASLDLLDPSSDFVGTAVAGAADVVYVSPNALYVGYSEYADGGPFPSNDSELDTVLHKFDISQGQASPTYAATGILEGTLSDQFALSERDGILRVATTRKPETWDTSTWSSSVYTLAEDQAAGFDILDSADGLAPGEEIFAARFVGRMGYLVTYEVLLGDPLFTLDLTDPEDIRVAGELPVTGWSDYIHPMDEDHLLTIGMDEQADGGWGLAVSIFDVTDLDEPFLQDREVIEAWGSEAQSEHHAFNYFPEQNVLAVPSSAYDSGTDASNSVLEVFDASVEGGLNHSGRIVQEEVIAQVDDPWCATIRRSVIMEDKIWAVGQAGLTASSVGQPGTELNAVVFEGVDPCASNSYGW